MNAQYTAVATSSGGRQGHVRSSDGVIDLDLTLPKELGGLGKPGTTNPEQLFAAGYAACFANAMRSAARRAGEEEVVDGATVTARVDIGAIGGGRFGLAVELDISLPRLAQAEAEDLVARAHDRCPYSNATRGNIPMELAVHGGAAVSA